ncbi:MAG: recombinase family protein [Clostridia bacterium]|nr:recombinase family protein [Clostridia bacterium]
MHKTRVGAYTRVSTEKEEQINSLQNQRKYFEDYINANPDWELAEIFFDEGASGTQTKTRAGFNRMIEACRAGEIDLILTKEVSRFARNTVDALAYTRQLKEYGVGVCFINDNIDTRAGDGELRLTIMSSIAQEESRKTSERVRWGQTVAMRSGVVFGNNSLYGYETKDGKLTVKDDEAEIVRLIFHKYINEGKGTHVISRELYEAGIDPPRAVKKHWSSTMILRILRNEKYVGDLLQKKYITKDHLTHKKIPNDGSEEMIYIKDHHEPIIDRDTWNRTQRELAGRRPPDEHQYSNRYWCSGKIVCSSCGAHFGLRKTKRNWGTYAVWGCYSHTEHGRRKTDASGNAVGCDMRIINDRSLLECMRFVTDKISGDIDAITDDIIAEISSLPDDRTDYKRTRSYAESKLKETEDKKIDMLDSYFSSVISENEMIKLKAKYDDELLRLQKRLDELSSNEERVKEKTEWLEKIRDAVRRNAVHSEEVYGEITDKIAVYDDHIIIKLKYLDFGFKIRYTTHGWRNEYTTTIESCETVALVNEP